MIKQALKAIRKNNSENIRHQTTAEILYLPTYRQSQNAHKVESYYFPVTVDDTLASKLQRVIMHNCSDSVDSLKVEPLPSKRQERIWIHLKASAFGIALHAIISELPCAELGPVRHIYAPLQA